MASTTPRVAEATPERWHRKFSAVRSAVRMPRAGPLMVAISVAGGEPAAVRAFDVGGDRGVDQAERGEREVEAGEDAWFAGDERGFGVGVGGDDGVGGDVAGAAKVFQ